MKTTILTALAVSALLITGCSSKNVYNQEPHVLLQKHKDLPSWVNNDSGMTAVGSATYKGQSYIQQKNQAVAIATMNMGRKIKMKVDSLTRDYYRSTNNKEALVEELNSQTTSQVSSEILSGTTVKEVYVSDDGEMFVQVVLDGNMIADYFVNNSKMQKYVKTQLAAEQSFKDLKQEVKEYKSEQSGVDSNSTAD